MKLVYSETALIGEGTRVKVRVYAQGEETDPMPSLIILDKIQGVSAFVGTTEVIVLESSMLEGLLIREAIRVFDEYRKEQGGTDAV